MEGFFKIEDDTEKDFVAEYGKALRKKLKEEDSLGYGILTRILSTITQTEEKMDADAEVEDIECFGYLFREVKKLYQGLKIYQDEFEEEWNRVKLIAEAYWNLEDGLETLVGEEIKPIEQELDEQEQQRRLLVLDKAKELFKKEMITVESNKHVLVNYTLIKDIYGNITIYI